MILGHGFFGGWISLRKVFWGMDYLLFGGCLPFFLGGGHSLKQKKYLMWRLLFCFFLVMPLIVLMFFLKLKEIKTLVSLEVDLRSDFATWMRG